MSSPVRLGLIGCADIAIRRVLPAVSEAGGIELTAVGSRDPEKAARVAAKFGGVPVAGYLEVLARADVDAVYLPLPLALHEQWVEHALEHGKHVLVEKPMTATRQGTEKLVALAGQRGLVLWANFMFPRHSQHDFVRRLLAEGAIGELRSMGSTFSIPPRPPGDIRHRRDLAGGCLFDLGVYPILAAMMFLGPDLDVAGAALRYDRTTGVDVAGTALLVRDDGVTAQLTFGMEHAYKSDYRLHGSTGILEVDRAFTPAAQHRPTVRVTRNGDVEEFRLLADDQVAKSISAFADAVRTGEARPAPATEVLRHVAIAEAIHRVAGSC